MDSGSILSESYPLPYVVKPYSWVSCDDALPESGVLVVVCKTFYGDGGETKRFCDVDFGWRYSSEFKWEKGGKVSHWMMMPELPNG